MALLFHFEWFCTRGVSLLAQRGPQIDYNFRQVANYFNFRGQSLRDFNHSINKISMIDHYRGISNFKVSYWFLLINFFQKCSFY